MKAVDREVLTNSSWKTTACSKENTPRFRKSLMKSKKEKTKKQAANKSINTEKNSTMLFKKLNAIKKCWTNWMRKTNKWTQKSNITNKIVWIEAHKEKGKGLLSKIMKSSKGPWKRKSMKLTKWMLSCRNTNRSSTTWTKLMKIKLPTARVLNSNWKLKTLKSHN